MDSLRKGRLVDEAKTAPKVSWKRIGKFYLWLFGGIAGLIVVLIVVLIPVVFVADIIHWHNVRREFLPDASLNVFPQPLPETSVAAAHGVSTLTQSGCSVDLPFANATVRTWSAYLPDGRSILFQDPANAIDEAAIFRGSKRTPSAIATFGASALQSNYSFLAAQVDFRPSELSPWPYGRRHDRSSFLATSKSLDVAAHKYGPIYSVALGNVRGFQLGDPQQENGLELRMFDAKDRQFKVLVSPGDTQKRWTQPEINFMVRSMRCDDGTYNDARQARNAVIHSQP